MFLLVFEIKILQKYFMWLRQKRSDIFGKKYDENLYFISTPTFGVRSNRYKWIQNENIKRPFSNTQHFWAKQNEMKQNHMASVLHFKCWPFAKLQQLFLAETKKKHENKFKKQQIQQKKPKHKTQNQQKLMPSLHYSEYLLYGYLRMYVSLYG